MPIPKDYLQLITQLASKARAGKVKWRKTRYGGYAVTVEGTNFEIWSGQNEDTDRTFVSFALVEPSTSRYRNMIDSWSVDDGEGEFDLMYQLYADARRHALGIPTRIGALEKALKNSDVVGEEVKDDSDDIPF
jgi:hypothetical protein